jgi:plastocyanin
MTRTTLSLTLAAVLAVTANIAMARQSASPSSSSASGSTATTQPSTAPRADQFASESQARSHCPGDTVVWVNTKTHVYHFAGNSAFGHTKHGAFMCRADADRSGMFHAAKNETPAGPGIAGSSTAPRR